jgi:hypothetical protein
VSEQLGGKEEGSDFAEPSLEGPVGQTTGNRPLNNQSPVNPAGLPKRRTLVLGLGQSPACASFLTFTYKELGNESWVGAKFPWVVAGCNPGFGIS